MSVVSFALSVVFIIRLFSTSAFRVPKKCELSSLGLELPGLGFSLGLGFYDSLGLGLVSKFKTGLGLGGYGLDYITGTGH